MMTKCGKNGDSFCSLVMTFLLKIYKKFGSLGKKL